MHYNTSYTKIVTDENLMETIQHGSKDYPFCFYYDNLSLFDFNCIDWHWHSELEFVLVEKGTVNCSVGEDQFVLPEGNAIFINSKVLHRYQCRGQGTIPNFVCLPTMIAPEESLIFNRYIEPILTSSLNYQIFSPNIPWQKSSIQIMQDIITAQNSIAAKELITRITNELSNRGIVANINEMYIGTFHSLCLRILKEHLEFTRLRRNYRLLDAFDQQYMVFQNIHRFRNIPEVEGALPNSGAWKQSEAICNYVNNLSEELVTPEELMSDADLSIVALGRMLKEYRDVLTEGNLMDFSSIQIETYHLLCDRSDILEEMRSKITHIMVDEYQDTNFIQEQLVFLLAGDRKNICVVGDDDQGLYRFRGATIRNILEFPQKFGDGECRIIPLVINYRSNSDIVDFYNKWMATTDGAKFKFRWENYRFDKKI